MKPIRIGNVEYREDIDVDNSKKYEEIVLWIDNPYYKQENEMKEKGWVFTASGMATKDNIISVESDVFNHDKICYTIAKVNWDSNHENFTIENTINLEDIEKYNQEDFKKVVDLIKIAQ